MSYFLKRVLTISKAFSLISLIERLLCGTGLELDIVPVVPIESPKEYVWQPQRGAGGKKYITSVSKQLDFAKDRHLYNPSFTSVVRAIKWWRNYKELKPTDGEPGLSSFVIELIVSYLEIEKNVENDIFVSGKVPF